MKKKQNIISISITLFIVVTVLITSSYAWYTSNQEVTSSNINVKAKVSNDMRISADAIKWKSSLTLMDIVNASYQGERLNQIPVNFKAFSTTGNVSNGLVDLYEGFVSMNKVDGSPNYGKLLLKTEKVLEQDGENGGFLAFDLYISSDLPTNIYLGKKSFVKYVGEVAGIENTIRIAFVKEGQTSVNKDAAFLQSLKTSNKNDVYIWEPNSNTHTESAIEVAKKIYDLDISANNEPLPYYGVKNTITDPVLITSNDSNFFELMENNITTPNNYSQTTTPNKFLFYMNEGVTKLRIYAWIEGQDIDCENNVSGSDFEFNLNFTTKVEE